MQLFENVVAGLQQIIVTLVSTVVHLKNNIVVGSAGTGNPLADQKF